MSLSSYDRCHAQWHNSTSLYIKVVNETIKTHMSKTKTQPPEWRCLNTRASSKYIILHLLLFHTASGWRTQTYSTEVTIHYWPPLLHSKQWMKVSPTTHSAWYSQLLVFIHTFEFRCIESIHTFHVTIHRLYAVGM